MTGPTIESTLRCFLFIERHELVPLFRVQLVKHQRKVRRESSQLNWKCKFLNQLLEASLKGVAKASHCLTDISLQIFVQSILACSQAVSLRPVHAADEGIESNFHYF